MNHPHVENEASRAADASAPRQASAEGTGQQAIAGPFGLRDIVVGSAVLVMLVGSVLPFSLGSGLNLWTAFSLFYVGIGIVMPLLAAGLFLARRLSPDMRIRVGSLSVDQFASVIAVLAVIFFFLQLVYVFSVGSLISLIGSVVLLAATTFAPHIPPFSEEFQARAEIPAHPVARDAQPLRRAPKPAPAPKNPAGPVAPAAGAPAAGAPAAGAPGQYMAGSQQAPYGGQQQDRAASAPGTGQPGAGLGAGAAGAAAGGAAAAAATGGAGTAGTPGAQDPRGSQGPRGNQDPRGNQETSGTQEPRQAGANAAAAGTAGAAAQAGAGAQPASDASRRTAGESQAPAGQDSLPATTVNPTVATGAPSSSGHGQDSISATREENENVVEAFWFAVGTPRQIVDERTGLPLFMFYPGDWELGLEDRGHEFLVQDKRTGRIGVLRDLTNIERVSDDSSGH